MSLGVPWPGGLSPPPTAVCVSILVRMWDVSGHASSECISASPCQGHCSCSGSLSSHRAHLFPTWPPSLCSSPVPDVRNLKLTSQLQQLQVSSWQNLKGLRGGVGGDLQQTNPPPPDPRTKQQSRGDNWFTSLGTPWKDLKYITVWTEPVDLHLCQ